MPDANGDLKPAEPVQLQENQQVRVTIESPSNLVRAIAGTDAELIERIALDPTDEL